MWCILFENLILIRATTIASGRLVRLEQEDGPEALSKASGSIVLASEPLVPNLLRNLQRNGAIGVILRDTISTVAGSYDLPNPSDISGINITVVQIGSIDTERLRDWLKVYNDSIIVQIGGYPSDRNYWLEVRQSPVWYAVQAVMSIFCFTALMLAVYKLVQYLRHQGFANGVPQICLIFETTGNIFRVIYWAVDPIFLLRGQFTYVVSHILVSIHVPMYILELLFS